MMVESEAEIKGGGKFIQRTRSVGGRGERKGKTDASNTYYIKNLYVKVLYHNRIYGVLCTEEGIT